MHVTRVLYGKIGRSLILEPAKFGPVGGDNEPLALLLRLAQRRPDVEFVVASRWSGSEEAIESLPPNVILPPVPKVKPRNTYKDGARLFDGDARPWEPQQEILAPYFKDADAVVMWAGQMGTSNVPIPKLEDRRILTNPQDCFMTYCAPVTLNINEWRDQDPHGRQEIWLCADPRNYLKARDLKWPPAPVIGQYSMFCTQKHERWGDERSPQELGFNATWNAEHVWVTKHEYRYEALEIVGIPDSWNVSLWRDARDRKPFGVLINEARSYVGLDRATITKDWIMPLIHESTDIRGKWSESGMKKIGTEPTPLIHHLIPDFLTSFRSTITTPSSGSQWATTKWHEAARLGTICFCHPKWDGQGHVIPTLDAVNAGVWDHNPEVKHLARWLRPEDPAELAARVKVVAESDETYEWLRDAQYRLASWYHAENRAIKEIERRAFGCTD